MMTEFERVIISTIEFHALKEKLDYFSIIIGLNIAVHDGCLFCGDYNILCGTYQSKSLDLVEELPNLVRVREVYLRYCSVNGFNDEVVRRSNFYCFTVPNVLSGKWQDVEFGEGNFSNHDHIDCILWIPYENFLTYHPKTKMSNIDNFNFYIRDSCREVWADINVMNYNNKT